MGVCVCASKQRMGKYYIQLLRLFGLVQYACIRVVHTHAFTLVNKEAD